MGNLLSLFFKMDTKPHHVEGDCRCVCDDSSESSAESAKPQPTSTKSAAVARDSPT